MKELFTKNCEEIKINKHKHLILPYLARDANAGPAVGNSGGEIVDAAGLMVAGEAAGVILALVGVVGLNVTVMLFRQPGDGSLNLPEGREWLTKG